MRVAIIGRTETLYATALLLKEKGYEIACIITAKEAPEYSRTAEDFRRLASDWNIPFLCTAKIVEAEEWIRACGEVDVGVSMNFSGIIPSSIIDLFPLGILNAHGGDLPRYRGNACKAWAILNGEQRVGLCIHRMIGGELDNGDIVARSYHPITLNTKVTELYEWMDQEIPILYELALSKLSYDRGYVLERQSKDPRQALRCYPRRPEDGRIDWNKGNIDILRLINACNKPYAGAFCRFEEQKMIIWDAELADEEIFLAVPGQVTFIGKDYIEVACGQGKLRIRTVQLREDVVTPNYVVKSLRQRLSSG